MILPSVYALHHPDRIAFDRNVQAWAGIPRNTTFVVDATNPALRRPDRILCLYLTRIEFVTEGAHLFSASMARHPAGRRVTVSFLTAHYAAHLHTVRFNAEGNPCAVMPGGRR
jgi:hypothetical protein